MAVLGEGVSDLELGIVAGVFGSDLSPFGVEPYRLEFCSATGRTVRSDAGIAIWVPKPLSLVRRADTVIVLPFRAVRDGELAAELQRAHRSGARIASVCTGAFALAEAGLLDGKRATTHWDSSCRLAEEYPQVEVDPCVLYIDEGDVLTSAGSAAGMDLLLHIVRKDHGAEVANSLARELVVPPHRDGGQAQFVAAPLASTAGDDAFASTLSWLREHVNEPITVEQLAERAAMSPRTFARRFVAATGTTPHRHLLNERVLLAQRLLETTDLAIEEVARRSGFGTAVNMRQHFRAGRKSSPIAYRRTFRAGGSPGASTIADSRRPRTRV